MTLIIGYIYRDSVQIIADSAVTFKNLNSVSELVGKHSTFNESTIEGATSSIGEGAQKITNLDNRLILTFAGSARSGEFAIIDIDHEMQTNPEKKLSEICLEYFNSYRMPAAATFIAGFYEDGHPILISNYQNGVYRILPGNEFAMHGTGDAIFSGHIDKCIASGIGENKLNSEQLLVLNTAKAQSISLNKLAWKDGVGGFFNGAYVDSGGIHWMPDTFCLISSGLKKEEASFFVVKYVRENVLYVGSTAGHQLNKIFWLANRTNEEEWIDRWKMELHYKTRKLEAEYYILLRYDTTDLVMLTKEIAQTGRWIKLETIAEDDQFRVYWTDIVKNFFDGKGVFHYLEKANNKIYIMISENSILNYFD